MKLERRIALLTSLITFGLAICICVSVARVVLTAERNRQVDEHDAGRRLFSQLESSRFRALQTESKLLAELPLMKAVLETRDSATIVDTLSEFGELIGADLLVAYASDGTAYGAAVSEATATLAEKAKENSPVSGYLLSQGVLVQAVAVPVRISGRGTGVLVAGYRFDGTLLSSLERMTRARFAVIDAKGQTLQGDWTSLGIETSALTRETDEPHVRGEYSITATRLRGIDEAFYVISARSLSEAMKVARHIQANMVMFSLLFCFIGVALSFLFARSIARPLRMLVRRLRELDPEDTAALKNMDDVSDAMGADLDVREVLQGVSRLMAELGRSHERSKESLQANLSSMENLVASLREQNSKLTQANRRLLELLEKDAA